MIELQPSPTSIPIDLISVICGQINLVQPRIDPAHNLLSLKLIARAADPKHTLTRDEQFLYPTAKEVVKKRAGIPLSISPFEAIASIDRVNLGTLANLRLLNSAVNESAMKSMVDRVELRNRMEVEAFNYFLTANTGAGLGRQVKILSVNDPGPVLQDLMSRLVELEVFELKNHSCSLTSSFFPRSLNCLVLNSVSIRQFDPNHFRSLSTLSLKYCRLINHAIDPLLQSIESTTPSSLRNLLLVERPDDDSSPRNGRRIEFADIGHLAGGITDLACGTTGGTPQLTLFPKLERLAFDRSFIGLNVATMRGAISEAVAAHEIRLKEITLSNDGEELYEEGEEMVDHFDSLKGILAEMDNSRLEFVNLPPKEYVSYDIANLMKSAFFPTGPTEPLAGFLSPLGAGDFQVRESRLNIMDEFEGGRNNFWGME